VQIPKIFIKIGSKNRIITGKFSIFINGNFYRAMEKANNSWQWTNGIVFSPANFPTTNSTVDEQLKGTLHWSSVSFAIKEKFEKQIVKENATINLVDVSVNEIFKELATSLKTQSKYATSNPGKSQ
jgi:hypothetical protein